MGSSEKESGGIQLTKKELIEVLQSFPDDLLVIVEEPFKTGYDKGDIYHFSIKSLSIYQGKILVQLGICKHIGGW